MIGSDAVEAGFWPCESLETAPPEARIALRELIQGKVYRASFLRYNTQRRGVVLTRQTHFFS